MKYLTLLLFAFSASTLLQAQSYTVSGVIRDQENGETLIGATVEAIGLGKGNVSNEYGFYSFSLPVSKDSIDLKYSYIGYDPLVFRILPMANLKMDVSLFQAGKSLTEVVIKANSLEDRVKSTEISLSRT
jgi:CarboxypepD_reg-like domain